MKAAIDEYYKLLEENPEDWSIINTIGDLYVRLGKKDEAIKEFTKIADYYYNEGFYPKAIAILKKIYRLDSTRGDIILKLAECYSLQGLPAEARSLYFDLAESYVAQKKLKEAIEIYEKIADLDKSNLKLRQTLAMLYQKEKMNDKALEEFNWVAESYLNSGKLKEAEEVLNQAKEIKSNHLRTINNLLTIYKKTGESRKALPLVKEALSLDKDNIHLLKLVGSLYYQEGKFSEAEELFNKILEKNPTEPDVIIKLGKLYISRRETDKAYELYEPLVNRLINHGKEDKAVSLLGLIISSEKAHLPSLEKLAEIYQMKGQTEDLFIIYQALFEEYKKREMKDKLSFLINEIAKLEPRDMELLEKYPAFKEEVEKVIDLGEREIVVETKEFEILPEEKVDLDEKLKEIDFYIDQGFYKNARDLLDALKQHFPEETKIEQRYLYLSEFEEEREVKPVQEKKEETLDEMTIEDIFRGIDIFPTEEKKEEKIKFYELTEKAKTEIKDIEDLIKKERDYRAVSFDRKIEDILKQFKEGIEKEVPKEDYETRYNLGIAYKELGLLEEAIREFELAARDPQRTLECSILIAECFKEKGMIKEAITWLQKAMEGLTERDEEWLSLKYDLALLYQQTEDLKKALTLFKEISSQNNMYRDVLEKIKQIEGSIS
ncbi:MAG: tetratricopeptide repeat protein [Candidatus Aminicenantia bacterium]